MYDTYQQAIGTSYVLDQLTVSLRAAKASRR